MSYPRYHPQSYTQEDIGASITEGIYQVKYVTFKHSERFDQDFAVLTVLNGQAEEKRHTFSQVLVEQLQQIVKSKALPCSIEVKRVKRYLTIV
jgi:trehalose-6-phosphate synthase